MSIKVKICGITNLEDALAASEAGADILGFVFWEKSPRSVTVETAARIAAKLPRHLLKAGVFVDPPEEQVATAIRHCGLNVLQFHGHESPGFCLQFGLISVKAFRIRDASSLQSLEQYPTDAWLLDAFSPALPGGTGERFNWNLAVTAKQKGRPIFLAGGLTPENVAEAVQQVGPYGVDVSSGVEAGPGRKDHLKIRSFLKAARSVA